MDHVLFETSKGGGSTSLPIQYVGDLVDEAYICDGPAAMDRLLRYAGDIVGEALVVSWISYQGPTIVTYVGDVVNEAYICEGPAIMDLSLIHI